MARNSTRTKNSYLDPASKKQKRWDKADPGTGGGSGQTGSRTQSRKKPMTQNSKKRRKK